MVGQRTPSSVRGRGHRHRFEELPAPRCSMYSSAVGTRSVHSTDSPGGVGFGVDLGARVARSAPAQPARSHPTSGLRSAERRQIVRRVRALPPMSGEPSARDAHTSHAHVHSVVKSPGVATKIKRLGARGACTQGTRCVAVHTACTRHAGGTVGTPDSVGAKPHTHRALRRGLSQASRRSQSPTRGGRGGAV